MYLTLYPIVIAKSFLKLPKIAASTLNKKVAFFVWKHTTNHVPRKAVAKRTKYRYDSED